MSNNSDFKNKFNDKMKKSINTIPYLNIFEEGEYLLRLCPIPSNPEEPAFEKYEIHKQIYHPDFKNYTQFICLGPGCPFCKFAAEFKIHHPKDAWQVVATPYFFWRIENKKTKSLNMLKLSFQAQTQLGAVILDMDRQGVSLQDPTELGRDILLTVTKTKTKNGDRIHYKFEALMGHESSPVSEKVMEELKMWETVKPLKSLFKKYSMEEAKRILQNQTIFESEPEIKKKATKASLAEDFKKKMGNTNGIDDSKKNEDNSDDNGDEQS